MSSNWGNAVSWLIVCVGWYVVNRQHNARETRKEVRASLLDLYKLFDSIEDLAFDYHTGAQQDPSLARKIKRELAQIPPRIKLALREKISCKYSRPLANFRQSVTLSNFDTNAFARKEHSDPFFDGILEAKRILILTLDGAYNATYK